MRGEGRDLSYADKEGLLRVWAGDEEAPVCTCLSGLYKTLIGENMAQKVRTIRLIWENDDSFKMDTNLDGGDWQTIIEMDENGYFDTLWESGVKPLCLEYFNREINVIGSEMKA